MRPCLVCADLNPGLCGVEVGIVRLLVLAGRLSFCLLYQFTFFSASHFLHRGPRYW